MVYLLSHWSTKIKGTLTLSLVPRCLEVDTFCDEFRTRFDQVLSKR